MRSSSDYYSLEASVTVAQNNLFIRPMNNDGADDFCERNERSQCKSLASLLEYMHKKKLSQVYSDLYKHREICATIPVASACDERSHSKLKLIKTETRLTSGVEKTEALLVIAVEKQIWQFPVTVITCGHICTEASQTEAVTCYTLIVTRVTYVSENESEN